MAHTFWEIKLGDADISVPYGCATISGSHKMHPIFLLDHLDSQFLVLHELSYFYPMCVDGGEEEDCENISHILPIKTIKLILTERSTTRIMLDESNF
jgi:hypothetical protein